MIKRRKTKLLKRNRVTRYSRKVSTAPSRAQLLSPLSVMILLIVGLGVTLYSFWSSRDLRSTATNNGPDLMLNPASKVLRTGESASFGILLTTNTDSVSAAEVDLTYDPSAIEVTSVSNGTILPVQLIPPKVANGMISMTLGSNVTAPFTGSGILATFTVKGLLNKTSAISFTSDTKTASVGKTSNTLTSKNGSTITVSPITTPTVPPQTVTNSPTPTQTTTGNLYSSLSATTSQNSASFAFAYQGGYTAHLVDVSTEPTFQNTALRYQSFGSVYGTNPIVVSDPTKWNLYTCGRTIYWRINRNYPSYFSPVQTTIVSCGFTPTPTSTHTPTPTLRPTPSPLPTSIPQGNQPVTLQGAAIYPNVQVMMIAYTQSITVPTFIQIFSTNTIIQKPPGFTRLGGATEERPYSDFTIALQGGERIRLCTQDLAYCSNDVVLQLR